MSTANELPGLFKTVAAPEVKPLEEAVWLAWLKKGRVEEERANAVRLTSLKWLAIAVLLASGVVFWSKLAPYGGVVKFIVSAGAIAIMLQAIRTRSYAIATLFGVLAVVYNPVIPVFAFSGDWERALVMATATPFIVSLGWRKSKAVSTSAIAAVLVFGAQRAAAGPADFSKYRNFRLGTDLAAVSVQVGQSPANAKLIAGRPALLQELEWSPQPLGSSPEPEAVRNVVFGFYEGRLFQITVNYDRYQTEGLTTDDIIESVSAAYGAAANRPVADKTAERSYAISEDVVARWEDEEYRLDLIRARYGPVFRLVATQKHFETTAQAALLEARRLDDKEAPQREAKRVADNEQSERDRLEKLRLINKPKFRP